MTVRIAVQLHPQHASYQALREAAMEAEEIERSAGIHADNIAADLSLASAYYELGVRQFTLGFTGPDYDLAPVRRWLEWRDDANSDHSRNPATS